MIDINIQISFACFGYMAGQTLYSTVFGLCLGTAVVLSKSFMSITDKDKK